MSIVGRLSTLQSVHYQRFHCNTFAHAIFLCFVKNERLEGRMVSAIEDYRAPPDQEGYERRREANNALDYIQERVWCMLLRALKLGLIIQPMKFV